MPLAIGDEITAHGQTGTLVATTATLDSNGRGTISYGGDTYYVTVLKHPATSRYAINPLSTNGADAYLRVGLAEVAATDTSPALYGLVFEDPYWAPQRHWQTPSGDWEEAAVFGSQDSTVIRAGWMPGYITVSESGTPQVGVYVDFRMTYETSHGECKAWWQPAYPFEGITSTDRGCFITDASGYVEWRDPDNTRRPVILPRLLGARGHRAGDAWDGAPDPERVLSAIECIYLQESVEVTEGADAELDVAAVQIDVTAPANCTVIGYCEDGYYRFSLGFSSAGTQSATGLPPGTYKLRCLAGAAASWDYQAHDDLECPDPGATYSITFGTGTTVAANYLEGIAYKHDITPLSGAAIWLYGQEVNPSPPPPALPPQWHSLGATGSDGSFSFDLSGYLAVSGVVITDESWGSQHVSGAMAWCPVLGARITGIRSMGTAPLFHEGAWPWGPDGEHENHICRATWGYLRQKNATTGEYTGNVYDLYEVEHGVVSEPIPRYIHAGDPPSTYDVTSPPALYTYEVCEPDGTVITTIAPQADGVAQWCNATYPWGRDTQGQALWEVFGGKINGYALRHSPAVVTSALPEPFRLGAEYGENLEPLEVRVYSETTGDRVTTWTAWECQHCHAPVWLDPSDGTYTRFACMECGQDMRAYWSSITVPALSDHIVTIGRLYGSGGTAWVGVEGHPRPEEYDETAGYQVANYLGSGYTRWVAVHIELGELEGGTFTNGESIADVETRLGRTVGPVMLKAIVQADYGGGEVTFEVDATHPDSGATTLTLMIPGGASEGDLFPLRWGPHHDYPAGYYTDITDVRLVAGSGTPHLLFVNDGSAWHSSVGVQVESGEYSPWGCDLDFGGSEPHLRIDAAGRVWLAYRDEGAIWVRYRAHLSQDWSDKQLVVRGAQYSWPCVIHWPDGSVRVAVMDGSLDRTVIWQSKDDGRTWESMDATG